MFFEHAYSSVEHADNLRSQLEADDEWIAENVTLTTEEHARIVKKSLFANVFKETGTRRLGCLFEEEPLKAQVSAYNSSMEITIPRLIERGRRLSTDSNSGNENTSCTQNEITKTMAYLRDSIYYLVFLFMVIQ